MESELAFDVHAGAVILHAFMRVPRLRSLCLLSFIGGALLPNAMSAYAADAPRAAAIVVGPSLGDASSRANLARAAIDALDRVSGVSPLRAAGLREALVPKDDDAKTREAFALATSARAIRKDNAAAAALLYERALGLVFEALVAKDARRFMDTHGLESQEALAAAGRLPPALARRLRLWREPPPGARDTSAVIRVEPDDARVWLNGRLVQKELGRSADTGLWILRHEKGVHDLFVERDAHASVRRALEISAESGAKHPVEIRLVRASQTGTEDVVATVAELASAGRRAAEIAPVVGRLATRLDVALVFVVTEEGAGALVRLYDTKARSFVAASPLQGADAPTLQRAFAALLDLRGSAARIVEPPPPPKKKRKVFDSPLWKKWWVWALVLGGAGAVTGAVLLSRQGSSDGSLTIRLRRAP
jgi:hypothetical protein